MIETITTLFHAAEIGDHQLVDKLLSEQPALVNKENESGLTLLGIAAHFGKIEVVKNLLSHGAEINAISHSKISFIPQNTALHASIAGAKSIETIECLLLNGADCNIKDSEGHTPLHIAAFEGSISIAKLLIGNGAKIYKSNAGKTPLHIAEERNHTEFSHFLSQAIN
ncbi:ankyrin repeat domain-containing protein [Bacillus sp. JJ664]